MTARALRLAMALAVAAGPIAACSDDGPSAGEAALEVDGRAVVVREGGDRTEITGSTNVGVGDVITLVEGTGVLDLGDGELELRQGLQDAADTKLLMAAVPVLQAGDVLASSDEEIALSVDETRVRVVAGSARASRDTGLEVAAYDADVEIDSAGQQRRVPALREMSVPALGRPPGAAQPLDYDARDPWDRRFLGEAIDLGQRLEALADGYTQNLPSSTVVDAAFFRQVLPGLADDPDFTDALLAGDSAVGETLIGAAIADLGERGSFLERWEAVFEFRGAGAAWGLVALDQGVDRTPLLGSVTQAVDDSPLAIGGRPTTTTTLPQDGTTSTTARSTSTTTPSSPTTTTTTLPLPGEPDDGGLLSPVVDPVTDLLSGLVGGLLGGLFASG